MSVETRDINARTIQWIGMPGLDRIEIHDLEISKRDFFIGASLFLAGDRSIQMGNVPILIPETPEESVLLGEIEMPYREFVKGVVWGMQYQRGTSTQELHFWPMAFATEIALWSAEKQLSASVPERNETVIKQLKASYSKS